MAHSGGGKRILVIDDDELLGQAIADELTAPGVEVHRATTGAQGIEVCRRRTIHVVLLDQKLPDATGLELCPEILRHNDQTKIVFMTAYPSFDNAVGALRVGAHDYLAKPFEIEQLKLSVGNALRLQDLERIEQLYTHRREREGERLVLAGAESGLREVMRLARLVASTTAPVLITGETGTGKSLLARYIHHCGARQRGPFVTLNCAALPETLAESELFGHEKGAFTDASSVRRGVFEMAEGGTVFLDEIGAMPVHLQVKLLGVLEDGRVRRVGGESARHVDARVVAATNLDLEEGVAKKTFRQDLYYRLSVVRIHLPPLRDRIEDLGELCRQLSTSIAGAPIPIGAAELSRLAAYPWPGNVRELRNILERALILQPPDRLAPAELLGSAPTPEGPPSPGEGPVLTLEAMERREIARALRHFDGNITRAAKALGIALSTLKRKLSRYGLRSGSK